MTRGGLKFVNVAPHHLAASHLTDFVFLPQSLIHHFHIDLSPLVVLDHPTSGSVEDVHCGCRRANIFGLTKFALLIQRLAMPVFHCFTQMYFESLLRWLILCSCRHFLQYVTLMETQYAKSYLSNEVILACSPVFYKDIEWKYKIALGRWLAAFSFWLLVYECVWP